MRSKYFDIHLNCFFVRYINVQISLTHFAWLQCYCEYSRIGFHVYLKCVSSLSEIEWKFMKIFGFGRKRVEIVHFQYYYCMHHRDAIRKITTLLLTNLYKWLHLFLFVGNTLARAQRDTITVRTMRLQHKQGIGNETTTWSEYKLFVSKYTYTGQRNNHH